ncbi:MAG TPA: DMT family transporter, partial [Flavobacteriales bacterium]|nr:DMT family transporter [Flavobacteriales bacterium]
FRMGIAVAVLSALLSAWFNIINAKLVLRDDAVRISFYEMVSAAIGMGLLLPIMQDLPPPLWELPGKDIIYHLILGLVCTSFSFVTGIMVMRQLSPFTVMLTVNLEPVYTIIIALLLWKEEERMQLGSYLGIAVILVCLLENGWYQRRVTAAEVVEPDPLGRG